VTVWGQLRPANHSGLQYALIEFQRKGQKAWAPWRWIQTTSPEGFVLAHVPIPTAGWIRLAWADPATNAVYVSRYVGIR
jgi:hypothetical protein